jgi:large subunit ribosomal protein L19
MSLVAEIEKGFKKPKVTDVKSGDTVRVHQKIREGNKERVQVFEGLVIRTKRMNSHTASITVRRIASGVGVEKSYLLHSPLVSKVEVVKRSKVRRNYLSYMRERTGKSARLSAVDFDRDSVNIEEEKPEPEVDKKSENEEPAQSEENKQLENSEKSDDSKADDQKNDAEVKKETTAEKPEAKSETEENLEAKESASESKTKS